MIGYYCFLNHRFDFQDYVCNGCHGWTMLYLNISDIAIITVKVVHHCCISYDISKSEATHLLKNYVVEDHE